MEMTQEEWRSVFDAFVTELADKDKLIAELRGEQARVDSNKEWLSNSPTPEVGQWVGWNGGECPVHPETVVDGIESNGCVWGNCAAKYCDWPSFRGAYRIVTPYVEPKQAREFWIYKDDVDGDYGKSNHKPNAYWDEVIHVREVLDDE